MLTGYLLAVVLTFLGTGLLYASWARLTPVSPALTTTAGWTLLAVAFWPWIWSNGVEFAWVLLFFVPACFAWGWVIWHNRSTGVNTVKERYIHIAKQSWLPSRQQTAATLGRLLLYIPFCGVTATWFTLALAKRFFTQDLDQGAFVVIVTPLLWGILVGWLLMTDRLLRSTGIIGAVGGLCAVLLYFTAW